MSEVQNPCTKCGTSREEPRPNSDWQDSRLYKTGLCIGCYRKRELTKTWEKWMPILIGQELLELDLQYPGFDKVGFDTAASWVAAVPSNQPAVTSLELNLFLHGRPGTGKSKTAAFLCGQLMQNGQNCEWVTDHRFAELVGALAQSSEREGALSDLQELFEWDVLFFDDLGATGFTEPRLKRLFSLIDYRYRTQLAMVFTSNLSPAGLARKIQDTWRKACGCPEEAKDAADRILRRIFGDPHRPRAKIVEFKAP